MENTKKMLLIEPSVIEKLKQGENLNENSLSRLDREMNKIMKSKLDDREKWALYFQTLQRYLHICEEKKRSLKISIVNTEDEDKDHIIKPDGHVKDEAIKAVENKNDEHIPLIPQSREERSNQHALNTLSIEYLLRLIPKTYKRNAEVLIKSILDNPEKIKWNDTGLVFINTNAIPDSNIIDLINHSLRKLKRPNPVAWQEFAKALFDIGVPIQYISNPDIQEFLQKYYAENLKETPTHRSRSKSKVKNTTKKIDWERWTPY